MNDYLQKKLKKIPQTAWILLAIILIGIFLRAYNFRNWIYISSDQVRDARLAESVIKGDQGWPLFGPHMNHADVLIGPMYYYFQIISGKIFGAGPEKMAYPDLFFSILSIPLFYFFLKRYFSNNLSLALTGLYSVSFYSIQYSRFALNPNISPFFTILFLLCLFEFIEARKKTHWRWIILLGIAWGVGVQLHVITLILLSAIIFFAFIFLMKNDRQTWKKWSVVLLIALILNLGQIIGDYKNNFTNTKSFIKYSFGKSTGSSSNLAENFKLNADCQIQANFFMASSIGDEEICTFNYAKLMSAKGTSNFRKIMHNDPFSLVMLTLAVLFFIFGYSSLIYYYRKETEKRKKYFLGLIIFYALFSFLIMIPIGDWLVLRYFTHIIFLPFIFLGFLINFLIQKFPKNGFFSILFIFSFFAVANLVSLILATKSYLAGNRSHYNYAVLGEIDAMIDFISSKSYPEKKAYYFVESDSAWTIFYSLDYESKARNFNFNRIIRQDYDKIASENKLFHIKHTDDTDSVNEVNGHKISDSKKFGQFIIYKLKN